VPCIPDSMLLDVPGSLLCVRILAVLGCIRRTDCKSAGFAAGSHRRSTAERNKRVLVSGARQGVSVTKVAEADKVWCIQVTD